MTCFMRVAGWRVVDHTDRQSPNETMIQIK